MTKMSLDEKKKLMQAARAAWTNSGVVIPLQSDKAGLEIRQSKRVRGVTTQETPSKSDPPAQEEPSQGASKRMKTLMTDEVCRADMEINSLMNVPGQSAASGEFKFWSSNFDGLRFLYDHLNATEDVNKVKKIGPQKITQNINSYLLRCDVLTRGLFESGDASEKAELKSRDEIVRLQKKLFDLEKDKKSLESEHQMALSAVAEDLRQVKASNQELLSSNSELTESLKRAQIEVLSAGDEAFDKAKDQVLCLYPSLDLSEVDYFKVVQDVRLVDLEELEKTPSNVGGENHNPDNTLGNENPETTVEDASVAV